MASISRAQENKRLNSSGRYNNSKHEKHKYRELKKINRSITIVEYYNILLSETNRISR